MISTLEKTATRFGGEDDERGSGRIQQLSPKEFYDAGFRDGCAGRTNYRLYGKNTDYTRGWVAGEQENPIAVCNLPATAQGYLERGWGNELLNPL